MRLSPGGERGRNRVAFVCNQRRTPKLCASSLLVKGGEGSRGKECRPASSLCLLVRLGKAQVVLCHHQPRGRQTLLLAVTPAAQAPPAGPKPSPPGRKPFPHLSSMPCGAPVARHCGILLSLLVCVARHAVAMMCAICSLSSPLSPIPPPPPHPPPCLSAPPFAQIASLVSTAVPRLHSAQSKARRVRNGRASSHKGPEVEGVM